MYGVRLVLSILMCIATFSEFSLSIKIRPGGYPGYVPFSESFGMQNSLLQFLGSRNDQILMNGRLFEASVGATPNHFELLNDQLTSSQIYEYRGLLEKIAPNYLDVLPTGYAFEDSNYPAALQAVIQNLAENSRESKGIENHKRSRFTLTKRIHKCAFMPHLGLPIGLCFGNSYGTPKAHLPVAKQRNDYSYLERQWPVHSMLGGGVGRR